MALPEDDPPPGVPEWVVTYGDMMSLLLTFFIMLVSMAEMKQDGKLRAALDSMVEQFGPTAGKQAVPGPSLQENGAFLHAASTGSSSEGGTKRTNLDSKGRGGQSKSVRRLAHGTLITLGGPCVFDRFSADLNENLKADLVTVAKVVKNRPNIVVVRGHDTREPLPPNSPYRDAYDLSFARAMQAAEFLINEGISRTRVQISAAGDSEPFVITRDKQAQAMNRRVDVFVLDTYISAKSERDK